MMGSCSTFLDKSDYSIEESIVKSFNLSRVEGGARLSEPILQDFIWKVITFKNVINPIIAFLIKTRRLRSTNRMLKHRSRLLLFSQLAD